MRPLCLLALVALAGCQREETAPPLKALAPAPFPPLQDVLPPDAGRDAAYRVKPAAVWGDAVPASAVRLQLVGTQVQVAGTRFEAATQEGCAQVLGAVGRAPVLLVPDADTYLAQAAPLLAS